MPIAPGMTDFTWHCCKDHKLTKNLLAKKKVMNNHP